MHVKHKYAIICFRYVLQTARVVPTATSCTAQHGYIPPPPQSQVRGVVEQPYIGTCAAWSTFVSAQHVS